MTAIPIVWLISIFAILIAAMVVSRHHLPVAARGFFGLGLFGLAVVTVSVGLRLEHGLEILGALQPHFAIIIAPALWLGFKALTQASGVPKSPDVAVTAAAIALAQTVLLLPAAWSADLTVSTVNLVFALLLARMLRSAPDAFLQIAPHGFRNLRLALIGATTLVFLIFAADAAIIIGTLSAGNARILQVMTGISGISSAVVMLGVLVGIPLALGPQPSVQETVTDRPGDGERALLERIDALMSESRLYTDPNLTLARLGRRLGCPARQVSIAINRVTGKNVSRYISGFRVRRAATLLKSTGLPITDIMLEVGFQSKSSFNTEFRRIHGQTPSEYRKQHSRETF